MKIASCTSHPSPTEELMTTQDQTETAKHVIHKVSEYLLQKTARGIKVNEK